MTKQTEPAKRQKRDDSSDSDYDTRDVTYLGQPIQDDVIRAIRTGKEEAKAAMNRDVSAFWQNSDVTEAFHQSNLEGGTWMHPPALPMEEEKISAAVEQSMATATVHDMCSLHCEIWARLQGNAPTDLDDGEALDMACKERYRRTVLSNGCQCDTVNCHEDDCDSVSSGYSYLPPLRCQYCLHFYVPLPLIPQAFGEDLLCDEELSSDDEDVEHDDLEHLLQSLYVTDWNGIDDVYNALSQLEESGYKGLSEQQKYAARLSAKRYR